MNSFLLIVIVPLVIMILLFWLLLFEGYGLPQSLKCKIGAHDHYVTSMKTEKGMGFFGGPVTTFMWTCRACGKRGYS